MDDSTKSMYIKFSMSEKHKAGIRWAENTPAQMRELKIENWMKF